MTAADIPRPVREHRADYWTWVKRHGAEPARSALLALRDHWQRVNASHFRGRLLLPYITLTEPSEPRRFGQCCPLSSWGSHMEIRIRPSLLDGSHPAMRDGDGYAAGRFAFVADVLCHETIHQWQAEVTSKTEDAYHGHGPTFTARANEIGAALGLAPVVARNRGGSTEPRSAQWPHNVRPAGHYGHAYRPAPRRAPASGDTCPRCDGTGRVREEP